MAKRRRSYGFLPAEHLERARGFVHNARLERKVVRKHLAAGQCAPAIRGLAMAGWALGRAASDRAGARQTSMRVHAKLSVRRTRSVDNVTVRTSRDLRKLADRVIHGCKVPEQRS